MIDLLPCDVIEHIFLLSDFQDVLQFACTCKKTSVMFSEAFFKLYAYADRGKVFWNRAESRPIETRNAMNTIKFELIRLHYFEKCLGKKMNNEDYYALWEVVDKKKTSL